MVLLSALFLLPSSQHCVTSSLFSKPPLVYIFGVASLAQKGILMCPERSKFKVAPWNIPQPLGEEIIPASTKKRHSRRQSVNKVGYTHRET